MKHQSLMSLLAFTAMLIALATAQNPVDMIAGPVQQHINQAQGELQQKVVQHITEGNITLEHLSKDVNATKEELKNKTTEELKQHANITQEDLQQKAKEEIKNQVNQRVQQPGFEAFFATAAILATAHLLRRKD
jgi:hypothetical protein